MANDEQVTSTTTIGPTIVIRGRLKVDENLIVRGRIDAEISSSKALIIESSGIVKANVRVRSARISGVLVGNVDALDKIEIASDGRVVGDLRAPRIVISDGAAFRGKIEMESVAEAPHAAEPVALAEPVAPPPTEPEAAAAPTAAGVPPAPTGLVVDAMVGVRPIRSGPKRR
jgi:cytoskeletal protein CcmA (bactofilin family)